MKYNSFKRISFLNLNNLISEINSSNKPTKTWNCYLFDDIEFPNDFEFSIFDIYLFK